MMWHGPAYGATGFVEVDLGKLYLELFFRLKKKPLSKSYLVQYKNNINCTVFQKVWRSINKNL